MTDDRSAPRSRERPTGRTQLLVLVVNFGFLAAIVTPNLLNFVQRGKQKRTMVDMRTLATAIEAYYVDYRTFPSAKCDPSLFTRLGSPLDDTSFRVLCPTYMATPLVRDGWRHFFIYSVDNNTSRYNIRSLGRNGLVHPIICGTTTDFNDDILFSNGTFIQWPEGTQN